MLTYLNLCLLSSSFLLLDHFFLPFLMLIREVDLDTQGVPESVDGGTMATNNAPNEVLVDLELDRLEVRSEHEHSASLIHAHSYCQ